MKDFLLTLEYPYTGFEQIGYIRVKARHINSAMNKARKHVKGSNTKGDFQNEKHNERRRLQRETRRA